MSRGPRPAAMNSRERLKHDHTRAAPLRELYPQLVELRVEFEFRDGTARSPSPQTFSYFPAARGFFRYACPCHSCNGEFDLSNHIAELAGKSGRSQRSRQLNVVCTGHRTGKPNEPVACPLCAEIRLSAVTQAA